MRSSGIGKLAPLIALNAVVVLAFVILGIALDFPFWLMLVFVIAEAMVSLLIVQRLARRG